MCSTQKLKTILAEPLKTTVADRSHGHDLFFSCAPCFELS